MLDDDLPRHLLARYCDLVPTLAAAGDVVACIKGKINNITKDLFACFENEYTVFAPMSNCFEVYGLDFMVDESFDVHLLEVILIY